MNDVILTVYDQSGDGYILDLYGQDTISMNFNFNSITSLESGEVYSQEFRIPATQNNCSLFGLQSDFNIVSNNDIKRKFRAILTVDTVPISEGFVQFKKSYIKYNKMSDFSIVFFGDAVDLGTNLKDLDFSVLDFSDAQHQMSYDNVWLVNDGGTVGGNDYSDHKLMWTLIDRGQQFITWPSNYAGTFVNASYTAMSNANRIDVTDLTPCLKGTYLIQKINEYLSSQSKRVIQLSTAIQDELDKMCMPFIGKDGNLKYTDNAAAIEWKGTNYTDDTLSFSVLSGNLYTAITGIAFNDVIDIGSHFDPLNNRYIIPDDGFYQFKITGTIRAELTAAPGVDWSPAFPIVPGFLVNGTDFYSAFNSISGGTVYPQFEAPFFNVDIASYTAQAPVISDNEIVVPIFINNAAANEDTAVFFNAGDYVEVAFASVNDPTDGGSISIIAQVNNWTLQKYNLTLSNSISLTDMAPENYQLLDFLRDIMKLTNAVAIPNYSNYGVVDIMTMNEYLGGGGIIDWTVKLDENAEMTVIPSSEYQTRKQNFTFSEGADVASQAYKLVGRVFGSLDLYDTQSDFTVGENKVEVIASTTPNQVFPNASNIDFYFPKFVNNEYKWVNPGARLFYFSFDALDTLGLRPIGGNSSIYGSLLYVPFIGHYDHVYVDLSTNDLNFAQEIPLHPITSAPANTMYLKYYNAYLQDLYSAESKVLTAQFNLDVTDILNLQFNDSIFLFNSYWRVLSVDGYNMGMNQSTSVTLIKKLSGVDLPNLCTDTAIAIEKDGSVQWMYSGSQLCCEQIGYFWNSALSKCYKSQNQGGIKDPVISASLGVTSSFLNQFTNIDGKKDPSATGTIVVGRDLTVTGAAKNSIVGGSDLLVQNKGIWYGGGNDTQLKNQSATGIMTWFGKDMFTSATMEAYVGQFLTLPNSVYTAIVTLNVSELDFTHPPAILIVSHYSIQTHSMIKNVSGGASGDIPHNLIIDSDPYSIGPFDLLWRQDLTNPAVINLYIRNLNGTYPSPQLNFTAQINVTQLGTE
jgi:hypothetical protein